MSYNDEMRFLPRRYDPWPDIREAHARHYRALQDRDDLSPEAQEFALRALRLVYDNYAVYATCGRDRQKLRSWYATKADEEMRDAIDFAVRWQVVINQPAA